MSLVPCFISCYRSVVPQKSQNKMVFWRFFGGLYHCSKYTLCLSSKHYLNKTPLVWKTSKNFLIERTSFMHKLITTINSVVAAQIINVVCRKWTPLCLTNNPTSRLSSWLLIIFPLLWSFHTMTNSQRLPWKEGGKTNPNYLTVGLEKNIMTWQTEWREEGRKHQ